MMVTNLAPRGGGVINALSPPTHDHGGAHVRHAGEELEVDGVAMGDRLERVAS